MDKTFLLRVNDSFKFIKTQLLLNDDIRKWLYFDVCDKNTIPPTIEQVADNIFLQPVVDVETTEPFNKKNYISVTLTDGGKSNNAMDYVMRIIVMCDKSTWELNGDVRPLLISQQVINILDGLKTKLSNPLVFDEIAETITTKDVSGFSLLFNITDGISDVNDK